MGSVWGRMGTLLLAFTMLTVVGCTLPDPAGPVDGNGYFRGRSEEGYVLRVCPPPGYLPTGGDVYDSKPFKSLFRPDSIDCWADARQLIDCVSTFGLVAPGCYRWGSEGDPDYDPDFRPEIGALLNVWNMPLAVECKCLMHEGAQQVHTGQAAFARWAPGWKAMENAGGFDIAQLTIDESFRRMDSCGCLTPYETAYELAQYIQMIREDFDARVVIMEPYPYFSVNELEYRIGLVNIHLGLIGEEPLDGFLMDPNWFVFDPLDPTSGSWEGVLEVETYCKEHGIPFGLIYWPSNAVAKGKVYWPSDREWSQEVIQQGYAYQAVGGYPDEFVIMSWLWAPQAIAREHTRYSFMWTVSGFANQFIY
jgi:hypothetical protein